MEDDYGKRSDSCGVGSRLIAPFSDQVLVCVCVGVDHYASDDGFGGSDGGEAIF